MGFRCAEPKRQHHLLRAGLAEPEPQKGIQPRYSGLRVTGHRYLPV